MADSTSSPTLETPKATSAANPPVQDIQKKVEPEPDQSLQMEQRIMRSVGGGNPETPPDRFAGALGRVPGSSQVGMLRQLQQSYGNQYVGQVIQANLEVGSPDDIYEQEADQVAEQIMRMPEPGSAAWKITHPDPAPAVQRMCSACEDEVQRQPQEKREDEEEIMQMRPIAGSITPLVQRQIEAERTEDDESEEITLQPKEHSGQAPSVTPTLEARLNMSKGSGQPLPLQTRSFMESRFGYDFSQIQVHTDGEADRLNRELGARAFTHTRDVYFGAGKYSPESGEGKRLLAHELTHVVQQRRAKNSIQKNIDGNIEQPTQVQGEEYLNLDISLNGTKGIVKWDKSPKLRLRSEPDTSKEENIIEHLEFNTKLTLLGSLDNGWYKVKTPLNNIGYVAKSYISINLPDEDAKLHRVEAGLPGYAISIAEKYYKDIVLEGLDLRHYVELLGRINNRNFFQENWKTVHFNAGEFIWIPGSHYAQNYLASQKEYNLKSKILDQFDAWYNLDEEGLGDYLFRLAKSSEKNYQLVIEIIKSLDDSDEDEVASAFIEKASKPIETDENNNTGFSYLDQILLHPDGEKLVNILYYSTATGYISEEDELASISILTAKTRQMPIEQLAEAMEQPMIFPLKQMGITVLKDAPLSARKLPNGNIVPEYPIRVGNDFAKDINNLRKHGRGDPLLGQLELKPDEIVGVKLYDEGGVIHYVPASGLILYANKTSTETLKKIGEVSSLAIGGFGGGVLKGAGWLAKTLIWADRVATAIGIISQIVNEHRGWIIENFGEEGKQFLSALNTVNTVASIYSIGRLTSGFGYASIKTLRSKWSNWRGKAGAKNLLDNQVVSELNSKTQDLIQSIEQGRLDVIKNNPGRPYKNLPDDEIENLVKTGDEAAIAEYIKRDKSIDFQSEAEFIAYTRGRKSTELDIIDAQIELELAQKNGVKKVLKDDSDYSEEIIFNGHSWKRSKNNPSQWCRFSDGELCYIFGEGAIEGISIRFFGRKGEVDDVANLLRKNLGNPPSPRGWQAHHIIPYELRNHPVIDFVRRKFTSQWNINDVNNGIFLPQKRSVPEAGNRSLHRGSHDFYSGVIETRLDELNYKWTKGILTDNELFQEVKSLQERFRSLLENGKIPLAKEA